MADFVIDTNVFVAASTADPNTGYALADHVPTDELEKVLDWLIEFRLGPGCVVLDDGWVIWREYKNRLSEQSLGMAVLREKLATARFHNITIDRNGDAVLNDRLASVIHDRADRKFVAVALADEGRAKIANATDTDWFDWTEKLRDSGIEVEQILEEWCRSVWEGRSTQDLPAAT